MSKVLFPRKQMAFRFDDVTNSIIRTEEREDGVYAFSTIARDGLLTYFTAEGKRVNELRPASANRNESFLQSLEGLPATIEHPRALLTNRDSSVGELAEKGNYQDSEGVVNSVLRLKDHEVAARAKKGEKSGLSLGYKATIVETPKGVWYDSIDNITYRGDFVAVQTEIEPNHIALTDSARGGKGVRIHFDSADVPVGEFVRVERSDSICTKEIGKSVVQKLEGNSKMTTKTVRIDNVDWEIEAGAAAVLAQKLARLDNLEKDFVSLTESLKAAEKACADEHELLDAAVGRADGYEEAIGLIGTELDELRADAKAKSDEDDDDDDDDDDKSKDKDKGKKKGFIPFKKGEKMDSDTINEILMRPEVQEHIGNFIGDEIDSRLDAFTRASELLEANGVSLEDAGITTRMDAMETVRTTIAALNKDSDFSEKSDDYVSARFDSYHDAIGQSSAHTRNLSTVVNTVRNDSANERSNDAKGEKKPRKDSSSNHKRSLSLSKR